MKNIVCILVFIPFFASAQFGNQDFGIWGGFSASTKLTDEIKVSGDFQMRTNDNAARLNQYFLDFGVKYKVNKHFSAGLNWRPRMKNERTYYDFQNRLYLDLVGKLKFGDVAFYLRSRTQSTLIPNDESSAFERVRLKAVFKLDKGLKAFIQDEVFFNINNRVNSTYTKNRFGIGVTYKVSDAIDVGLKYLRINEVNTYYPLKMNVMAFKIGLSI